MKVLILPPSGKESTEECWSIQRIQFADASPRLVLNLELTRQVGPQKASRSLWSQWLGYLDLSAEQWILVEDTYSGEQCPERPCRRDFACFVSGVGELKSGIGISVVDPKHLKGNDPSYVFRSIETSPEVTSVYGLEFSPDGRWLFGIEEWDEEQSLRCGVARGDIRSLFAAKVIEEHAVNRFTGEQSIHRSVPPMQWTRFATLPVGVSANVLAVSPDGQSVAVGALSGDTHVVRVRDGAELGILPRKSRKREGKLGIRRIVFHPSANQLGVISEGQVNVWDTESATWLWATKAKTSPITDVAWHPNGGFLGLAHEDGSVSFLDTQSGKLRHRFEWTVGKLFTIAFSPDGLTCAAGGDKGQIVLWDLEN